jgi:inorganic pyrophosphatase
LVNTARASRDEIEDFFAVHKTLEARKSSAVCGYYDVDEAWQVVEGARQRVAAPPA